MILFLKDIGEKPPSLYFPCPKRDRGRNNAFRHLKLRICLGTNTFMELGYI